MCVKGVLYLENLDKKLLGNLIRRRRTELDLSTEEFAYQIGVDPNTLNRIERGVHLPESNTMYKMSRFINVQRLFDEHHKLVEEHKQKEE